MDNRVVANQKTETHLGEPANDKLWGLETPTREQLDAELQKGLQSIKEGKIVSADDVDAILSKEFGI